MESIVLKNHSKHIDKTYHLPTSKSISNRLLALQTLYNSPQKIINLSKSDDTMLMQSIVNCGDMEIINCKDAGTVARFIIGIKLVQNKPCIITGAERLKNRPISDFIKSLELMGAEIEYLEKENQLPIKIISGKLSSNVWTIKADKTSQYVSSLCMIAPSMKKDISILIEGQIVSQPYITSTLILMRNLGFNITQNQNTILYKHNKIEPLPIITCPIDYSSLAFPILELSINFGKIKIPNATPPNNLQGDEIVLMYAKKLNIDFQWQNDLLILENKTPFQLLDEIELDFLNEPDLSIPIIVAFAFRCHKIKVKNIEHLTYKESNRIHKLIELLKQLGFKNQIENGLFIFTKSFEMVKKLTISVENDHRIAMTLACISSQFEEIHIDNKNCVSKSFPLFWQGFLDHESK